MTLKSPSLAVLALRSAVLLLATGLQIPIAGQEIDYRRLKEEAERQFAEGSYARAHELYVKADGLNLPAADARWVDFRIADTLWRAQAGSKTADSTRYQKAQEGLNALIRDVKRIEDRDRVWAEVHESMGDFHWTRPDTRNFGAAWPHYQSALDWWAASKDIDPARDRYLKLVWMATSPPWRDRHHFYGYYGNMVPLQVLENSLEIVENDNDEARAHFLIAMTIRQQGGDVYQLARASEEFEAALKPGKATEWYDDALFHLGEWLMTQGRLVHTEDGQASVEPDYVKALEVFRRFIREHEKGETAYFDRAKGRVDEITRPQLGLGVHEAFIPGSEVRFHVNWRNTKRIDLALYPIDFTRDVDLAGEDKSAGGWLGTVSLAGRETFKAWTKETGDTGEYKPGAAELKVELGAGEKIPTGAYVLDAKAEGLSARDLVLVTDAALVLKAAGRRALLYFADASDGSPIARAQTTLWERRHDGKRWIWSRRTAETDGDGLAVFDLPRDARNIELFGGASLAGRQAFAVGHAGGGPEVHDAWRIYAFTDRPAYRPGERVEWKVIARTYDGSVYSTPAGRGMTYQIVDPRGAKVSEGKLTLSEFGSGWGSLDLTEAMPLGSYTVNFQSEDKKQHRGQAQLFRLEEYKLPEFRVSIRTPEEDGKRRIYRLGERVDVTIAAEYYFGGPVSDAKVEAVVYQKPHYGYWRPYREYPWYFQDMDDGAAPWMRWGGPGQIVRRETLQTDANGKTVISIETPRGQGQNLEYRIEARVTDSSRREIVGSESIRVGRQRYAVHARPEHNLYRPGDNVRVSFHAQDLNEQPVEVEGTVKVTRSRWIEVWLAPDGREVKGDELRRLREKDPFPPPGERGWRLKFNGWEHEDVLAQKVKTDSKGDGELTFAAPREGYYRVAWKSEDRGGPPVTAETVLWVLTNATTELGYRHGPVQIVADRDTFRAGQKAPVMITTTAAGRSVLFSVEGDDLYSFRLVRMDGTAKLIEVDVEEKHVPNVFLSAVLVSDRQIASDAKQVVVPPVRNFLTVDVETDQKEYLPRGEGTLTVKARDHEGKPVQAELALSLVDESVFYIQSDLAGDPRQHFFGHKRGHQVQTHSTFEQKSFERPEPRQDGLLGASWDEESDMDARKEKLEVQSYAKRRGLRDGRLSMPRTQAPGAPMAAAEAAAGGMVTTESRFLDKQDDFLQQNGAANEPGAGEPAVVVRSDFRTTILWQPSVVTGADGTARVPVKFPDSLTGWRATTRVSGQGSQFGSAAATVRTRQPLIVRLQAPRFFVAGDLTVVSAVVNNNTDRPLSVAVSLQTEGIDVTGLFKDGQAVKGEMGPLLVPASSESRADWVVSARVAGSARLRTTARAEKLVDAMEKTYLVHEHGVEKFIARSGKLRGESALVKLDLPRERKPESTRVTVQVASSLAVTMLDALPYLADYPYGCVEQTMSRFLPALITARTLKEMELKPEEAMERIFGGIERAHVSKTQPGGKKDLKKLDEMAQAALRRLYDFQHSDGGWGWWKEGESDHFMTAYVVWGLVLAQGADLDVRPDAIERGAAFLEKEIVEADDEPDLQAWMLHALAARHASSKAKPVSRFTSKAIENLWKNRDALNAYSRALFALAVQAFGQTERAKVLARNLENGVKRDARPDVSVVLSGKQESQPEVAGTAHWGEDGLFWRWSEGGVEATAFALKALLAIDPENPLVEPSTNWLIKNRRGAQWSNTRDTAIVILTLNDYLKKSGEISPEVEYEVSVNGQTVASRKIAAAEALNAPSRFEIDRKTLREEGNEVRIVRKGGKSPLYFAVEGTFFSLEEPIPPAGNEIFVRREYERLALRPTLLKGHVTEREILADQGRATSGERVEVIVTIEAKNNLEYIVLEDLKPAGLEAVEVKSGGGISARELKEGVAARPVGTREPSDYTGRSRYVYQELRDRKVALFLDRLPQGIWEIRYEMRAEVPGRFHALPLLAHAMYVPEIRASSAELRIQVEDEKPDAARRVRRAMVGGKR